jgi:hypothetical protein
MTPQRSRLKQQMDCWCLWHTLTSAGFLRTPANSCAAVLAACLASLGARGVIGLQDGYLELVVRPLPLPPVLLFFFETPPRTRGAFTLQARQPRTHAMTINFLSGHAAASSGRSEVSASCTPKLACKAQCVRFSMLHCCYSSCCAGEAEAATHTTWKSGILLT